MKMIIITIVIAAVVMVFVTARHRCFFTEVEGTILADGQPVREATVSQYYRSHWYDNPTTNTTTTDDQGVFSFPEASQFGFLTLLHQPVIEQELVVNLGHTNLLFWDYGKMNYAVGGEAEAWHRHRPFPKGLDARVTNQDECLKLIVNINEK